MLVSRDMLTDGAFLPFDSIINIKLRFLFIQKPLLFSLFHIFLLMYVDHTVLVKTEASIDAATVRIMLPRRLLLYQGITQAL